MDDLTHNVGDIQTALAKLCLENGYPIVAEPLDADCANLGWRAACWAVPLPYVIENAMTLCPSSDLWIACGRSVVGVCVTEDMLPIVEAVLGPIRLMRTGPNKHITIVFAAAEPILSQRLPGIEILGLASRFKVYSNQLNKTKNNQWLAGEPSKIPLASLCSVDNFRIALLVRKIGELQDRGKEIEIVLDMERNFLEDVLSSRARLFFQILLTILIGKKNARAKSILYLGRDIPEDCRGLVLRPAKVDELKANSHDNVHLNATGQNFFAETALAVAANGYSVLPVYSRAKNPLQKRHWRTACWQMQSKKSVQDFASDQPSASIGLACGRFVTAVDIDASDPDRVAAIVETARDVLGRTPLMRVGRSPRLAMLYRCKEPIITTRWRDLEVLGLGSQIVAYGIHPKTGRPYSWGKEGEPATTELSALPAITNTDVERFMKECINRMGQSAIPVFDLDARNLTPIVSSINNLVHLLIGSFIRDKKDRRVAVRKLIEDRYYGTGSGLAVNWQETSKSVSKIMKS